MYFEVVTLKEAKTKYFYIREKETWDILPFSSRYLMHKTKLGRLSNTVRRSAFAILYYMEYLTEKNMQIPDVYKLSYSEQTEHFVGFLKWVKAGNHTEQNRIPKNETCNAYLKDVFRFFDFLEKHEEQLGQLSVLSYEQSRPENEADFKWNIRYKTFKGYLRIEERNVKVAQKDEILSILKVCTNCRDQILIMMMAELGFRIGEMLNIDYIRDIDYQKHEIKVVARDDNENDARAKDAEERRGKISADTFDFLLCYLSKYWDIIQKQNYLFVNIRGKTIGSPMKADSVYDMFKRMEGKTGIKITPHMLRRYYANARWEADWTLEMICHALGHKHLDTTIRYLNVMDNRMEAASNEFYKKNPGLYGVRDLLT